MNDDFDSLGDSAREREGQCETQSGDLGAIISAAILLWKLRTRKYAGSASVTLTGTPIT